MWGEPHRIVQTVANRGLHLVAQVDCPPKWASARVIFPATSRPDHLADWTEFLTALATRYAGWIQAYEVWDGANHSGSWGGPPDPAAYAILLEAGYPSIKAVDPQALIVSAALASTSTSNADAMPHAEFVRRLYQAGAMGSFDILGKRGWVQGLALHRPSSSCRGSPPPARGECASVPVSPRSAAQTPLNVPRAGSATWAGGNMQLQLIMLRREVLEESLDNRRASPQIRQDTAICIQTLCESSLWLRRRVTFPSRWSRTNTL